MLEIIIDILCKSFFWLCVIGIAQAIILILIFLVVLDISGWMENK